MKPAAVLVPAVLFFAALLASPVNSADVPATARRAFGGILPRVSPDGKWVAVSYQGALCKVPVEGGTLTRLTSDEGWDVEPTWSPDSQRIAFFNAPGYVAGLLHVVNAADGSPIPLSKSIRGQGPLWFHPDGQRILGRFGPAGIPSRLAWCRVATGELEPVAGFTDAWVLRLRILLAVTPDGAWIVYAEHRDAEGEQTGSRGPQARLWRMPANGGTPEPITEWPARIYSVCADATSTGVFIVTDRGASHNDVWHVPFANSLRDARKLSAGQADEDSPSTDKAGRTLVFSDNRDGATMLVRRDLTSGEERAILVDRVDFRAPTAELRLKLTEKDTGQPAVARVALRQIGGKFHAPFGMPYHLMAGLGQFYCRHEAALTLPAGKYELLVSHGPEYRVVRMDLDLSAGQTREVAVPLERWVHAAAEGWFSGENHIHANYGYGAWYNTPRSILDFCEAEDLNVANLVVANSDGDGVFDREFFLGRPDTLSRPRTILYWNQEFRSTHWGHMTLFHLSQLVEPVFTGFADTTNPWDVPTNGDIARRVREQRGAASYTHPTKNLEDPYDQPYAAKGLPADAALGLIDCLDVMGSVYEPTVPYWYRLLNCGFRLPAAAGTDCFLNRVQIAPPGWGRAYVHLPDGLSYEKWVAGVKAGRSFVSNGPMLEFTAGDQTIGGTLRLNAPGKVRVKGRARAQHPLEKLELVQNGAVIATGRIAADRLSAVFDENVELKEGGWLALRVSGPTPRHSQGGSHSAHTNPIYIEVRGRPFDSRADVEYFLRWMDRLEADVKRRDRLPPGGAQHVQTHLNLAREVYRSILRRGELSPRK